MSYPTTYEVTPRAVRRGHDGRGARHRWYGGHNPDKRTP